MTKFRLKTLIAVLATLISLSFGIEVRGANQSLEIASSARRSGMAGVYLGMPGDLSSLYQHPASLNDLKQTWILLSHYEHYESSQYDHLSANIPLNTTSNLGFSLARFGADGIPLTKEGVDYESESYNTFSISDYIFTSSIAINLFKIDFGASLHLLYRSLDQDGFGYRTDISADYKLWKFRFAGLIKGITTSGAKWESDVFEYAPPELYTGVGFTEVLPYLYGTISLAWQSSGYFHKEGKSTMLLEDNLDNLENPNYTIAGDRITSDPKAWFLTSSVAFEFNSTGGLYLRGGIQHLNAPLYFSMGVGVTVLKHTKIDYSFQNHPDLSNVHHISISFCPAIFNARHLRNRSSISEKEIITPPIQENPSETKLDSSSQNSEKEESSKNKPLQVEAPTEVVPNLEPIIIFEEEEELIQ